MAENYADGPSVLVVTWLHFHECKTCHHRWGCTSHACLTIRGSHLPIHPLTGKPSELLTIPDACRRHREKV